jgi:hypothetical protein
LPHLSKPEHKKKKGTKIKVTKGYLLLLLLLHGIRSWKKRKEKEKLTSSLRERSPTTFTMSFDIINKTFVFFFSPCTFVGVFFLTARRSAHDFFFLFVGVCANQERREVMKRQKKKKRGCVCQTKWKKIAGRKMQGKGI